MKNVNFFKVNLFVLVLLSVISLAEAQYQRMGIRKGTKLTIPAKSNGKVNTFCMDYTLEAPKAGTSYKSVLSDPASARVKFMGEPSKSLQEAIDAGEIAIEGVNMTFESLLQSFDDPAFINRLPREEREEIIEMKDYYKSLWDKLTQEEKNEINREISQMGGDHTRMRVVNNKNKPASVYFVENSAVAVDKNVKKGSIDESLVESGDQAEIWKISNMKNQKKLSDLGLYDGQIDGVIGERSKHAIRDFQSKNGLAPTGLIDSETDQLLIDAVNRKKEEIEELQRYLTANTDNDVKVDGVVGGETRKSIDSFKDKHGMSGYDIDMTLKNNEPHMKFNKQDEFIDYCKKLDDECNPELCVSDSMSLSLSHSCFPGSLSVSASDGLNLSIQTPSASYDILLIEGKSNAISGEGCRLSRGACFSQKATRDYSIQCTDGEGEVEISASGATLSYGNLSVSIIK